MKIFAIIFAIFCSFDGLPLGSGSIVFPKASPNVLSAPITAIENALKALQVIGTGIVQNAPALPTNNPGSDLLGGLLLGLSNSLQGLAAAEQQADTIVARDMQQTVAANNQNLPQVFLVGLAGLVQGLIGLISNIGTFVQSLIGNLASAITQVIQDPTSLSKAIGTLFANAGTTTGNALNGTTLFFDPFTTNAYPVYNALFGPAATIQTTGILQGVYNFIGLLAQALGIPLGVAGQNLAG